MSDPASAAAEGVSCKTAPPAAMPWRAALLLACGNLAVGAISPLYDSYVPPLLERHLTSSLMVGAMMGVDNAIMLCVVPMVGVWSDRTRTRLGRRMPFVLAALPVAAVALAALPLADLRGFLPLLLAMIILNLALAAWRAPFSALLAELIPSVHRSMVGGLFAATMCLAAMLVLGGSRTLYERDARLPFLLAAMLVLLVWLVQLCWLREPRLRARASDGASPASPLRALRDVLRAGEGAALRFFLACLFFHVAFQSFSSWFTTHGAARFGVSVADCSIGFIAVAVATLAGSLPAGGLGRRFGRRRAALAGLLGMAASCALRSRPADASHPRRSRSRASGCAGPCRSPI
ncbi:MAG: MFS transporter [Planctomycetota bacterium]